MSTSHDNDNHTVKIDLVDLLALMKTRNQDIYESATLQKLDGFLGLMRPVLEECNKEVLIDLLGMYRDRVYQVGKEVGINNQKLGKKLEEIIV